MVALNTGSSLGAVFKTTTTTTDVWSSLQTKRIRIIWKQLLGICIFFLALRRILEWCSG